MAPLRLKPLTALIRGSFVVSAALAAGVQAGPQGGNVVAGQGSVSTPSASTTVINQQSQSLAIDWQSFNIGQSELVQFNQPNSSATALNRVVNGSPTQILGSIRANGQVFLINPSGVVFSKTSQVNVGGLFVSSLDIANEDFMAGTYATDAGWTSVTTSWGCHPDVLSATAQFCAATYSTVTCMQV